MTKLNGSALHPTVADAFEAYMAKQPRSYTKHQFSTEAFCAKLNIPVPDQPKLGRKPKETK